MKVLVRRYRLLFCLFTILALFCIQGLQNAIVSAPAENPTTVGISHIDFDPTFDEAGYQRIRAMVREAVEEAGGLGQVVWPGCSVVIKPNMVEATPPYLDLAHPNSGADTNCWVTRAVVELAREAGAGLVVIAEGTAEDENGGTGDRYVTRKAFYNCGYDRSPQDMVDDYTGAPLIDLNDVGRTYPDYPYSNPTYDLNKVERVTLTTGLIRQEYWLPRTIMDYDVLITVPTLKNHNGPGVTGALKNGIGYAPNDIYHQSGCATLKQRLVHTAPNGFGGDTIAATIVDLNQCRKPDFAVIDGLVGVLNGPAGYGKPLQTPSPKMRCVIAGRDPVAVDTVCSLVMGYDYNTVPYLANAALKGLGTRDLTKIIVKGTHIAAIRYDFPSPYGPATRAERVAPVVTAMYPADGAYAAGVIGAGVVSASDVGSGLLKAELYVDGQFVESDSIYPYEFAWDSRTVSDGVHDLAIYVYDRMMNEQGVVSKARVRNSSPLVSLRALDDGTPVTVSLTASTAGDSLAGRFYLEQPDRLAGICVLTSPLQTFAEGSVVEVSGAMTTLETGERAVSAASVRLLSAADKVKPLALANHALGGASSGTASGPDSGLGAYNVGLLITTWGRVTGSSGNGFFYIDDGTSLRDGSGYQGVRIVSGSLARPTEGTFVSVTGISSLEIVSGRSVRCVRARAQSDIIERR